MTRGATIAGILALVSLAGGCIFGPDITPPIEVLPSYLPQTSPENVLENLQTSYLRREIAEYAKLLHPEFVFRFQPQDVLDAGSEYWNRDQDSTQTDALFRSDAVTRIGIDLTYNPATPIAAGSDTVTIRVNPTFLEVDELTNGIATTWRVSGDIQDMFFVRSESDPTIWQIIEWRDIDGGTSAVFDLAAADRDAPPFLAAVHAASWGALRSAALTPAAHAP